MQNGSATTLESRNEGYGFFGTVGRHADPNEAWTLAMDAISKVTGNSAAAVRDFLDSRYGRHFGDEVASALAGGQDLRTAIDTAVSRWMEHLISKRIEDELGIPRGLPYLTASCACTRRSSS
jgi:hypothetical protein